MKKTTDCHFPGPWERPSTYLQITRMGFGSSITLISVPIALQYGVITILISPSNNTLQKANLAEQINGLVSV